MHVFIRLTLGVAAVVGVMGLLVAPAAAHERRQVGNYIVVVGFDIEPTYVEESNAALITVFSADGQPVEGVDKTLKVEVSVGGASRTFDLKPKLNRPGNYIAEFIPTKTGIYTFRFFGTVGDQAVNERFESGPGRFDEVVTKADLQFPAAVPSNGELAAGMQSGGTNQGGQTQAAAAVSADEIQAAVDKAESARTTGITVGAIGIVLAVVALGVAGYALASRRGGTPGSVGGSEPV